MRVLVIDDSDDIRDLAEVILGSKGIAVAVAEDGQSGVEAALALRPDLILLDVYMDGWSGEETLREIRERDTLRSIPVAFMTGENRAEEKVRLMGLGAVGIVEKPFSPASLSSMVEALLRGNELPGAATASEDQLLNATVLAELAELADDDQPDFLFELAQAFFADAASALAAIQAALAQQDRIRIARLAHTLKSSSGNIGAAAMSRVAQTIESSAAEASFDDLRELAGDLSLLLSQTEAALGRAMRAS